MKKRVISLALLAVILCSIMVTPATAAESITETEIMAKLSSAELKWSNGSIYIDKLKDGCGQCFGFVRELFYYVFGADAPNQFNKEAEFTANTKNVQKIAHLSSGYKIDELKALLSQAKPGDILVASQNNIKKFPNHVVIVRSATTDGSGVYVYDANGIQDKNGNELIRTNFLWTAERIRSTKPYAVTLYRYKNYISSMPQPLTTVTITFDPNGGTVSPTTQVIEKGSDPRNLPTAVREGYTFCGWTLDRTNDNFNGSAAAVTESSGYGFEEDTTIYAQWITRNTTPITPPTTTFYVILDDGSTCRRITVTNGSAYGSLPTPTKDGYTFDGWYTQKEGGSEITASTKVNLTSDQTLYAHWTQMAHEHIKSNPMISPEHPHYTFYTCTCGKVFTDYKTNYDDSCTACVLSELGGNLIDEPNPVSPQPKPERPQKEPTNPQYHWGPWSEWSTDPVSRSDTREVQTRTVTEQIKISSGSTEYRYGGYATSDGRHECWCETYLRNKFGSANLRYSDWSTTRYSVNGSNWTCGNCNGSHTHVDHYGSDGRAWWPEYTLPNGQNYYWEEIRESLI